MGVLQQKSVSEASGPYRVLVVDDSAVIRGLVTRWLTDAEDFEVVASATNGVQAVREARRTEPDLVVLDIEMPEMDGLTALPQIVAAVPGVQVVMASTLTLRNADISLRALAKGAADYVPKPEAARTAITSNVFKDELLAKLRALGGASGERHGPGGRKSAFGARAREASRTARARKGQAEPKQATPAAAIKTRAFSTQRPSALLIGSSTGGPQALFNVLGALRGTMRVPILIVQHMPPMFTAILAEHITKASGFPCAEAKDGEAIEPGRAYVAPGDFHMRLVGGGSNAVTVKLDQGERINFCRPAVDPLFESGAKIWGGGVLACVLTGMGSDGREGARIIADKGGTVLAQDAATSVVWGMPGAVANEGLASAVLPLDGIAPKIKELMSGSRG